MDEVDLDGEPPASASAPRWTLLSLIAVAGLLIVLASFGGAILHRQERGQEPGQAASPGQPPSVRVQLDPDGECGSAGWEQDVLVLDCRLRVTNAGLAPLELVGVDSKAPGLTMAGSGEGQLLAAGRHGTVVLQVKVTCAALPPALPAVPLRLDVITSDRILRPSSAPLRTEGTSLAKQVNRLC